MEDHVRPACCQKKVEVVDGSNKSKFKKALLKVKNFFFGCCR